MNSPGQEILANPEFQSKRKRRATLFGAEHTKYQPEMIFLDLFRTKNVFCGEALVKLQNTKVLLDRFRQPQVPIYKGTKQVFRISHWWYIYEDYHVQTCQIS